MKENLLNIKLPKKYEEGLFKYEEGIDSIPEWPMLQKNGWTFQEHLKLHKLVEIEHMKYLLDEVSEDEMEEVTKLINNAINEYNQM